jgi:hypothetical protein
MNELGAKIQSLDEVGSEWTIKLSKIDESMQLRDSATALSSKLNGLDENIKFLEKSIKNKIGYLTIYETSDEIEDRDKIPDVEKVFDIY